MDFTRRQVLEASGGLALAGATSGAFAHTLRPDAIGSAAWLQRTLEKYVGFGKKASGGAGDEASCAWIEGELTRLGYICERHGFEVPYFEPRTAILTSGAARAAIIPQAIVRPTGAGGLTAPLRLAESPGDLSGAIALVSLPSKFWVAVTEPAAHVPIADAFARGAGAVVAITNGPSGEAVALNVDADKPGFERPVALLAPRDAAPFLAAAASGRPATLAVDGKGGRRMAYNLIARLNRRAEKTLLLSTPRSGWFLCAAERGSGLAAWFSAAQKLAMQPHGPNLEAVVTSGHEYNFLGSERYLKEKAPAPEMVKLWAYIGASFAARDWKDVGGKLVALPTADPQRRLSATADIIDPVRRAFKGVSGLEDVLPADMHHAGGELRGIIRTGYRSAFGEAGGHRYFHTRSDDMRCVSGGLLLPASDAYMAAIKALI